MPHQAKLTHIYFCLELQDVSINNSNTYVQNLISIFKEDFDITLVRLDRNEKRFQTIDKKGYRILNIPLICSENEREVLHHYRNITFLIKDIISAEQKNIFHLNSITNCFLAFWMHGLLKSKIILTVHDNYKKQKNTKIKYGDNFKRDILKSIERTKTLIDACNKVITTTQYNHDYMNLIASNNRSKIIFIPEIPLHSITYKEKMLTLYNNL